MNVYTTSDSTISSLNSRVLHSEAMYRQQQHESALVFFVFFFWQNVLSALIVSSLPIGPGLPTRSSGLGLETQLLNVYQLLTRLHDRRRRPHIVPYDWTHAYSSRRRRGRDWHLISSRACMRACICISARACVLLADHPPLSQLRNRDCRCAPKFGAVEECPGPGSLVRCRMLSVSKGEGLSCSG